MEESDRAAGLASFDATTQQAALKIINYYPPKNIKENPLNTNDCQIKSNVQKVDCESKFIYLG